MTYVPVEIWLLLLLAPPVAETDVAPLPRPDQVDKPEMIRFIEPDPRALPGIVVDDVDARLVGQWKHSVHTPPFVAGARHQANQFPIPEVSLGPPLAPADISARPSPSTSPSPM